MDAPKMYVSWRAWFELVTEWWTVNRWPLGRASMTQGALGSSSDRPSFLAISSPSFSRKVKWRPSSGPGHSYQFSRPPTVCFGSRSLSAGHRAELPSVTSSWMRMTCGEVYETCAARTTV